MKRVHDEGKARAAESHLSGSKTQGTCEPDAKEPSTDENERAHREKRSGKLWAGAATVLTGSFAAWLAAWLLFYAGPPTKTISPALPTGHSSQPSARQGVPTTSPGHRFYVVANFSKFPGCGRPCSLPLYQLPTHDSADVTQGWPCEYYQPSSASRGPYCLQPPTGRTKSEMANSADENSGDRLLLICQVTNTGNGQATQTIRNEAGQSSGIWDMVAVPAAHIFRNSGPAGRLSQVPGMPGFYEAYGPDIWFGDIGWHNIPCR